jgi:hypothetical protein
MIEKTPGAPPSPDDLPRSPTGRIPQWVIDEANGRPPMHAVPFRALAAPPRRTLRSGRRPGALVIVVAVVVASLMVWGLSTGRYSFGPQRSAAGHIADFPSPGHEEAKHPLGTPAPIAVASTSYAFIALTKANKAVAYDPCRPIHYVVRPDNAPATGALLITQAIARVSLATGLKFIADAPTREAPSSTRESYQHSRYGNRWAPVLIAWETEAENPAFVGEIIGEGGSNEITFPGAAPVFVTGQVRLDAAAMTSLIAAPNGQNRARAVIEHELGHVAGLDHVQDRSQLMYPEADLEVTDYGPGDLAGLAILGAGPCVPQV